MDISEIIIHTRTCIGRKTKHFAKFDPHDQDENTLGSRDDDENDETRANIYLYIKQPKSPNANLMRIYDQSYSPALYLIGEIKWYCVCVVRASGEVLRIFNGLLLCIYSEKYGAAKRRDGNKIYARDAMCVSRFSVGCGVLCVRWRCNKFRKNTLDVLSIRDTTRRRRPVVVKFIYRTEKKKTKKNATNERRRRRRRRRTETTVGLLVVLG